MSDATINTLLNTLESSPDGFSEIIKPVKEYFLPSLQITYDLYREINGTEKKQGEEIFSRIVLLGRSINDLLAGFHLATQGYILQSYTVLRPILESMDLVKLFEQDQKYTNIWINGGKKSWKELSPSKVRTKLGKESYDLIYGHFCEYGAHPTFNGGSGMTAMRVGESRPRVTIWIGGVHNDYAKPRLIFLFGFIFLMQMMLISEISKICYQITEKDYTSSILKCIDNFQAFAEYSEKSLGVSDDSGLSQISQIIQDLKIKLNNIV